MQQPECSRCWPAPCLKRSAVAEHITQWHCCRARTVHVTVVFIGISALKKVVEFKWNFSVEKNSGISMEFQWNFSVENGEISTKFPFEFSAGNLNCCSTSLLDAWRLSLQACCLRHDVCQCLCKLLRVVLRLPQGFASFLCGYIYI